MASGWRRAGRSLALLSALWVLQGCASLVGSVTQNFANDLGTAILESDDPDMVRDGAPAYLILIDRSWPETPKTPVCWNSPQSCIQPMPVLLLPNLSVRKNSI